MLIVTGSRIEAESEGESEIKTLRRDTNLQFAQIARPQKEGLGKSVTE